MEFNESHTLKFFYGTQRITYIREGRSCRQSVAHYKKYKVKFTVFSNWIELVEPSFLSRLIEYHHILFCTITIYVIR